MKPKLFFILGHGETENLRYSKDFLNMVKNKYKVIPVILPYDKKLLFGDVKLSELILGVDKKIKENGVGKNDIILGFSIGGLVAYILSTRIRFNKSLVCSMSSILGEDAKKFSKTEKELFTKDQLKEISAMNYKKPKSETFYFVASKESPIMSERPKKLHELYGGTYISIGKWGHKFSGKYLDVVKKFL